MRNHFVKSIHLVAVLAFVIQEGIAFSGQTDCDVSRFDLGDHTFPISTASKEAQAWFDQGINWSYGFNHAEAIRNFQAALRADPTCAMCQWGVAFALGPNINKPMSEADARRAYEELKKAEALSEYANEKEKAYIAALAQRYSPGPVVDRSALDLEFAEAMGDMARSYPEDLDAWTLYAEALMNTMPWNYWDEEGEPRDLTDDLIQVLERVMEIDATHPGANHYYIHIMEAHYPEQAEQAADRLRDLVPDAGHLRHMPSHIYLRVGRYQDAVIANQLGIEADKRYLSSCHPESFYIQMYIPHNYDFLVAAASFQGQSELALQTAEQMSDMMLPHLRHGQMMIDVQQFWITHLMNLVRFGKWDEVLAWPEPQQDLLYARGLFHYARAIALMRKGHLKSSAQNIARLEQISNLPALEDALVMGLNSARNVLKIGVAEAKGELAAARGDFDAATELLEEAVNRQDQLLYIEPPSWYHSVRLTLGTILLQKGAWPAAEEVFREDLERFPTNGWALFGLAQALQRQGALQEAAAVENMFSESWRHGDFELTAPRL